MDVALVAMAIGESFKEAQEAGASNFKCIWSRMASGAAYFARLDVEHSVVERASTHDQIIKYFGVNFRRDGQFAEAHVAGNR